MTARIKSETRTFIIPTTYENSLPNVGADYDRPNRDHSEIVRSRWCRRRRHLQGESESEWESGGESGTFNRENVGAV